MKPIISITALLAILALAIIGVLYIFEMISVDYATSTLIKVEAAIILLGGCSALVALLTRSGK